MQGIVLVQTAVDELRRRLVVLPSLMVLERLCAEVATRAQRKIFAILTAGLTARQRWELDQLLELREGSPYSTLAWLRLPPGAPTAKAILAHIERLKVIFESLRHRFERSELPKAGLEPNAEEKTRFGL